jgi:hypothetical protein
MLAASRHELKPSSELIELLICLFAGWSEQGQPVNQCNQTLMKRFVGGGAATAFVLALTAQAANSASLKPAVVALTERGAGTSIVQRTHGVIILASAVR